MFPWMSRRILVGVYLHDYCWVNKHLFKWDARLDFSCLVLSDVCCSVVLSSSIYYRTFFLRLTLWQPPLFIFRYGDTTAKSVPARIFAIVWVLTGLCLTSILIGDLSASLSHTVSAKSFSLYGAKVKKNKLEIKGELNPKIEFVLFERTLKITE